MEITIRVRYFAQNGITEQDRKKNAITLRLNYRRIIFVYS